MIQELIATGFYVGRFKYAPGTLGSLIALPLIHIFAVKWWVVLIVGAILYLVGVWASNYMIDLTREDDPEQVVIDEVLGYFVSYLFIAPTLLSLLVGFITFRVLDIYKPYPIPFFERLPEGHGVMADDLVAGLINACILFFLFK